MINTASIGSVGIIGIGAMGWPWRWICSGAAIRPACATAIRERWQPLLHADWLPVILPPRCETAIVVVVDAVQIDAVMFGEGSVGGVVQALRPAGARRQTVVLCSTIAAADSEHFKPESILDLMST